MILSKETIAILKNFSTINGGIYLRKGNSIMTRSISGATYGEATINDTIDVDLAIYDLNGFLSILSLADNDADISLSDDNNILIKGKRLEITWPAAEPDSIVYPKKSIQFPPSPVEFEIQAEDFGQIMRVARGLGADTLAITRQDNKIIINSYNKDIDTKLEKPLSAFEAADYHGDLDFNFIFKISNMKMQTDTYNVKLWASGDKFAAAFNGTQINYVLAVEIDSTHSF